jgi:hypothetical protein
MQESRRLRASALAAAFAATALLSGCFLPSVDPGRYYLGAPLVPIGGASGGGHVDFMIDARQHSGSIELFGLDPNADYTVTMDGVTFTTLSTDAAGHAQANVPVLGSSGDPRGRRIAVLDPNGVEVLELADSSHPDYNESEIAPLSSFASGGGFVQTTTLAGVETVSVSLAGVDPGSYDLVVDGQILGTVDASDGQGTTVLTDPEFDPGTSSFELQLDGVGYYAGGGHANIEGIDWCNIGNGEQALESAVTGIGRASLLTRIDCGRRFEVAIENVPLAEYDLFVGGVHRGTLAVGEDENGATVGVAQFSSSERSMAPLDFDPIGQSIEVELGGVSYFTLEAFAP